MRKIALVDDDAALVDLMAESLGDKGFQILKGYDGERAMVLARTKNPELMILDVNMPCGTGLDVLKMLRADPRLYDLPVILLTGVASAQIYPAIEAVSRVVYLKKPLDLEELNSIVSHVLSTYKRLDVTPL